jgi:hypothetical protein
VLPEAIRCMTAEIRLFFWGTAERKVVTEWPPLGIGMGLHSANSFWALQDFNFNFAESANFC